MCAGDEPPDGCQSASDDRLDNSTALRQPPLTGAPSKALVSRVCDAAARPREGRPCARADGAAAWAETAPAATNLGVRRSNLFGRAHKIKELQWFHVTGYAKSVGGKVEGGIAREARALIKARESRRRKAGAAGGAYAASVRG
jgi:hypothetical protein